MHIYFGEWNGSRSNLESLKKHDEAELPGIIITNCMAAHLHRQCNGGNAFVLADFSVKLEHKF